MFEISVRRQLPALFGLHECRRRRATAGLRVRGAATPKISMYAAALPSIDFNTDDISDILLAVLIDI